MGVFTILDHDHDWELVETKPFPHNDRYATEVRKCQTDECDAKRCTRIVVGDDADADVTLAELDRQRAGQQRLGTYEPEEDDDA